jgi:hypothetical protein
LVPSSNSWDVHPVTVTDNESHIKVLGESPRGPHIIV